MNKKKFQIGFKNDLNNNFNWEEREELKKTPENIIYNVKSLIDDKAYKIKFYSPQNDLEEFLLNFEENINELIISRNRLEIYAWNEKSYENNENKMFLAVAKIFDEDIKFSIDENDNEKENIIKDLRVNQDLKLEDFHLKKHSTLKEEDIFEKRINFEDKDKKFKLLYPDENEDENIQNFDKNSKCFKSKIKTFGKSLKEKFNYKKSKYKSEMVSKGKSGSESEISEEEKFEEFWKSNNSDFSHDSPYGNKKKITKIKKFGKEIEINLIFFKKFSLDFKIYESENFGNLFKRIGRRVKLQERKFFVFNKDNENIDKKNYIKDYLSNNKIELFIGFFLDFFVIFQKRDYTIRKIPSNIKIDFVQKEILNKLKISNRKIKLLYEGNELDLNKTFDFYLEVSLI